MNNKKLLVVTTLLRRVFEIFFNFFLNIYLFNLVNGDFNFILLYTAFGAIIGAIFSYFLMRFISSRNAHLIFKLSFIAAIICMLLLLFMRDQILSIIWIFAALQKFSSYAYYAVYEITLMRSSQKTNLSSFIAGVNILGSIIALIAPIAIGYTITNFSWHLVFVFMLADAIAATVIATRINFKVINDNFHLAKYWQKALKNPTLRKAYLVTFLRRLSGSDGVLGTILPILLFITLGTEFSAGSYNSLFSVIYIIMLEIVRIFNRKSIAKKFYVPISLLALASAAVMLSSFNTFSIILFYFIIKTGGELIMTESTSMIYSIGNQQKLSNYAREHQFTWNLFLSLGSLAGVIIAFLVYNIFYSKEGFASVIFALMSFFVVLAYLLQNIEKRTRTHTPTHKSS